MGIQDRSLIDKINPTFIALTATAIDYCQSDWKTGGLRVQPEFRPGGGAQRTCDTRKIDHAFNNAHTDEFHPLDVDFRSSWPEVQAKIIHNIHGIIWWRIHSPGIDPAMIQLYNDQGSVDHDFLDYVSEELTEQPDNCFNCLSSFIAATEASMKFSAVLLMGGSTVSSSTQPVPWSNSNSNSNVITSIESTGLFDGSTIRKGAMSFGGEKWWQWSDLGFSLCAIYF